MRRLLDLSFADQPRERRAAVQPNLDRDRPDALFENDGGGVARRIDETGLARTAAVPIVGWPAKAISVRGVKMRTRRVWRGSAGGSTKVVSAKLNSRASVCMARSLSRARPGRPRAGCRRTGAR